MARCRVSSFGSVSRKRRRMTATGFAALMFALAPSTIGFQDLGALLVHQPGVAQRWREHLIASPFGTIHAAMFSLPSPIGTSIPHPPLYAPPTFDPTAAPDAIGAQPLGDGNGPLQFPTSNRKDKRDSLISRKRDPMPPLPPLLDIGAVPQTDLDTAVKKDEERARFD